VEAEEGGTVVVLTALDVEYQAVRGHLAGLREQLHEAGTLFETGWLNGTPWQVALAEIGDGNQGAAVLTERAIAMFRPRAVFFVGVAGALKPDEPRLGDVVVATRVHALHGGKEENGEFLARPRSWPAPHGLQQLAQHVRRTPGWAASLPRVPGGEPPRVHLKPVAAGEVVLNSPDSPLSRQVSPLRELLRQHYQDAVAIEMESAGMAQAAHLNNALPALTVRGISDRADGRKHDADAAGSQEQAARSAAAFAFAVIRRLPYGEKHERSPGPGGGSPAVHVVSSSTADSRALAGCWRGGEEVEVGDRLYLLHDGLLAERPSGDHALIHRQARAVQIEPDTGSSSRYVWIRQVEARRDSPRARDAAKALAAERDLLEALRPRTGGGARGLPRLAVDGGSDSSSGNGRASGSESGAWHSGGRRSSLVLDWPVSRATRVPCETLDAQLGAEGEPFDEWRLHRLLSGVIGLCGTLAVLHREGVAHRGLSPAGIVALDDGRLVLRDLGLAAREPEPDEGAGTYQAPEQRRRDARRPGSWTDVYRLGAVTYHLTTGTPHAHGMPHGHGTPLPMRALVPGVPEPVDRAIRAALAPDPTARPDARALAAALRDARGEHF
jgi:nucleoside phosphorylase